MKFEQQLNSGTFKDQSLNFQDIPGPEFFLNPRFPGPVETLHTICVHTALHVVPCQQQDDRHETSQTTEIQTYNRWNIRYLEQCATQ